MFNKQILNPLLLLLAAFIWGIAFVFQSVSLDHIGPFTFNTLRLSMGAVVLLLSLPLLDKLTDYSPLYYPNHKPYLIKASLICGICTFLVAAFQQVGLMYTTVGKAGFITAAYIILVPILGIPLKRKTRPVVWLGLVMAVVGLYLLCLNEELTFNKGDLLTLCCAFMNALHILAVDHFIPHVDGVRLSIGQFLVSAVLSSLVMFFFEDPQLPNILAAWAPILYTGIVSCAIAYTLQIVGQKNVNPSVAALMLGMESLFAALAGWVFLHEVMTGKEKLGCAIMFAAILLVELMPEKRKKE